jgi:hypothetical protein
VPQAWHAAPPVPHALLAVPVWHVPPASQQPFGQLVASHSHTPATQAWPLAQATQAAPSTPHVATALGWQLPLASQQPLGQLAASHSHTPATQAWPPAQATQAAPSTPHVATALGWQLRLASQQPSGQLVALQASSSSSGDASSSGDESSSSSGDASSSGEASSSGDESSSTTGRLTLWLLPPELPQAIAQPRNIRTGNNHNTLLRFTDHLHGQKLRGTCDVT